MERYVVCLDPGHGPDTVNGSPDGAYKEREFTWDMGSRLRRLLEEQGIWVVMTREENEKPSLTQRAQVSNASGANLFVSIHSSGADDIHFGSRSGRAQKYCRPGYFDRPAGSRRYHLGQRPRL